jgi:N-acetylglucosamine-6-phosphate deacetylase
VPGVLGIHLEGPYLNDARRGVHDPVRIREWESDAIDAGRFAARHNARHAGTGKGTGRDD